MKNKVLLQEDKLYNEFLEALRSKFSSHLIRVILFGSRAKGIAKPWSDYDFLIVLDSRNHQIISDIYDIVTDFLIKYGVDISLKIYAQRDFQQRVSNLNPFIKRVLNTGVELWSKKKKT